MELMTRLRGDWAEQEAGGRQQQAGMARWRVEDYQESLACMAAGCKLLSPSLL